MSIRPYWSLALLTLVSCGTQPAPLSPSELPDLSLFQLTSNWTDQNGKQLKLIDLQGKPLILAMIYTSCQGACPRIIADMRSIHQQLGKKDGTKVRMVLVSIDPETDTPARLKAFAGENQLDQEPWLFLHGNEADVRELANVLAFKYKQVSALDFAHSNMITVINRQGLIIHQQEGLNGDHQGTLSSILGERP